jgi:hypothetical protein
MVEIGQSPDYGEKCGSGARHNQENGNTAWRRMSGKPPDLTAACSCGTMRSMLQYESVTSHKLAQLYKAPPIVSKGRRRTKGAVEENVAANYGMEAQGPR